MPRYFFDIHDGIVADDHEGRELPSVEAARATAMQIASAYAGMPMMVGDDGGVIVVVVRDAPNEVVMTVRLAFNVETRPKPDARKSSDFCGPMVRMH